MGRLSSLNFKSPLTLERVYSRLLQDRTSLGDFFTVVGGGVSSFFASDFEEGNFSEWNQSPPPRTTIANESSNYGGASGSFCLHTVFEQGIEDGGGSGVSNIDAYGGNRLPSHFRVRFDIKLSSNWHYPLGQKLWRSLPDFNSGQLPGHPMFTGLLTSSGDEISLEHANSVTGEFVIRAAIPGGLLTTNVWHRVEFRIKENTYSGPNGNADGQMETFLDGTSLVSLANGVFKNLSAPWLRDHWCPPGNYTSPGDPIPADQTMRVDNFVIVVL